MANSHPGSYCGQDAYSDMLVTEKKHDLYDSQTGLSYKGNVGYGVFFDGDGLERPAGNYEGGDEMDGVNTVVRRLTPLECERLQGYPDEWSLIGEPEENTKTGEIEYFYTDTNGKRKRVSDSARYKALGNSIALPFWQWLARRIVAQYEHEVTMGSLFDGISGFPLVFKRSGATPVWSSEIEEFPIAVAKQHFGDEDAGTKGDIGEYL